VQTATDYGSYLANEASPLYTSTIVDRCTQKLVEDWNDMRCQVNLLVLWYFLVACMAKTVCNRSSKKGKYIGFTQYLPMLANEPAVGSSMQATPNGG